MPPLEIPGGGSDVTYAYFDLLLKPMFLSGNEGEPPKCTKKKGKILEP